MRAQKKGVLIINCMALLNWLLKANVPVSQGNLGPGEKPPFSKRTEMFEVSKSKASVCLKILEKARQEGVVSETQYCSLSCQVTF